MNKRPIIIGFAVGLIILSGIVLSFALQSGDDGGTGSEEFKRLGAPPVEGATSETPRKAPDFVLTNQAGKTVSMSQFEGKVVVITFIYLDCKTVCPQLVRKMQNVKEELGPMLGEDVVFLAVDFDLSDDQEKLKNYAEENNFGNNWHLLTGDGREVDSVMRQYGVYAENTDPGFDHNAVITVVDRNGRIRKEFRGATFYEAERIAKSVKEVANEG